MVGPYSIYFFVCVCVPMCDSAHENDHVTHVCDVCVLSGCVSSFFLGITVYFCVTYVQS